MSIFTGSGVAVVTPFLEDGSVNYDKLEELLEYHCGHRTDGIVVCGTTGEASTLSMEERAEVIRFAAERVKGRVPVIAGTGSNSTQATVQMSQRAEQDGADGLLVVTPYYNKCTQQGLEAHYKMVAREVSVPLILYNVESRTGVNIAPETMARLYREVENIVGVKEASGDISQAAWLMHLTDGKIDLYSGKDDQIVPVLSLGGRGVISVLANIAPEYTHDICAAYLAGNVSESRKMQLEALPLIKSLFCEVNPIPIKKACNLLGMNVGSLRMPLTEMTEEHAVSMAEQMRRFGLKLMKE